MFEYEVSKQLLQSSYGPRTYMKPLHTQIISEGLEYEVARIVMEVLSVAIVEITPLTSVFKRIAVKIHGCLNLPMPIDNSQLRVGEAAVNWVYDTGIIETDKFSTIQGTEAKEQWFIKSISQELTEWAISVSPSMSMLSPIEGYREWVKPTIKVDEHRIPIVKKASRYDMLGLYTYDKMPDVYKSLNRLGKQGFKINKHILSLTETLTESPFAFIPRPISEEERKSALRHINDISRKAKWIAEIQFEEMNKWLLEDTGLEDESIAANISKKKANEKSQDYLDTMAEPHLNVISDWSKRLDFDKIVMLANDWDDSVINYLFNMCTRGRIYAVQNFLTPLGSDLAKAMIVFNEEYQISGYDFCIHIANCFGQDKLSFADRVKWVNDNSYELQMIGIDPIANYHLIQQLGLEGESKTRWQGIAACQVYVHYCEHIIEHGTEEGFTTSLIIGLDATASGTQVLSILGRDDRVAPYVNISAPLEDKVGDFYTFLSKFLKVKMESHRGSSDTLDIVLNNWDKYSRKLSKRNSMTFSYSGTEFGFGQQHWEDRHSYNKDDDDKTGSNLTRNDCRILGKEMYKVCLENIRGGAEIMQWLREGIDHHEGGAVISWTMPDGFTAFQACDDRKKVMFKCTIGNRNISLVYYTFQDKPKKRDHKNGIAPNWVHSFDAYLLRLIVLGMPEEAPISTVHDQFSTCSYFIQELQDVAKDAYKVIGDREAAERICEDAFGTHRPLPLVGTWKLNEIDNAEFIIC